MQRNVTNIVGVGKSVLCPGQSYLNTDEFN